MLKIFERLGAFVKQGVPGPMPSRTSVAGGEVPEMKGLHKAENTREVRSLRQAGSPRAYSNRGLPVGRLDKPLLFNDYWLSVQSPPATKVRFRCAPPHVASFINGNGVVDWKLLMSEGAAAASSCVAGPLSPGMRSQK